MTDLSTLSDDELRAMSAAMAAQDQNAMTHHQTSPNTPYFRNDPTEGMSTWDLWGAGLGRGMVNVGRHAANLLGLESDQNLKDSQALDAPLLNTRQGETGGLLGETALLTPLTMGASSLAGATGLGARILSNPLLRGGAEGAFQGGLMSDPGQRGLGAVAGGATGFAIPATLTAGQKLAYGLTRTPEAQYLINQGVRLTPGQMNPEGVWNKIEENVRSVPVVGNVVEKARNQSASDFQRGVIEEASAPGYKLKSTSQDPNELFQEAQDSYKPLYQAASGFDVKPLIPSRNQTLAAAMKQATNNRAVGAGADIRQNAEDFVSGKLGAIAEKAKSNGGWKSDHLIELRSSINEEIRNAGQDQSGKKYAQLLRDARDRVTESIESQIPAEAAESLKTANDSYPKLAIIRDAIKRGGDQAQGFTPAQLSAAVKQATDNNEYARGGGLMRDWSSVGRDIFTERNPRTGASHGTTGALAGAAYALHHFVPGAQIPAAAGAAGALGMIGTQTGRNILAGETAPQKGAQRLAEALSKRIPPGQRAIARTAAQSALNRAAVPALLPRAADTASQ